MLTDEQIQSLRQQAGIPKDGVNTAVNQGVANVAQMRQMASAVDMPEQPKGFLGRLGEAWKERGQEFAETFHARGKGEIGALEATYRTAGDIAGGVGDVIGAALSPAVEKLAKQDWAQPAMQKLGEGFDAYETWKAESPRNTRVGELIESTVNIVDLIGMKGLTQVGKAGVKKLGQESAELLGKGAAKGIRAVEEGVAKVAGGQMGQGIIKDLIPTAARTSEDQLTKALKFTKDDVAKLQMKTGTRVGEWMGKNNLIKNTVDETKQAVEAFKNTAYNQVRDTIGQIERTFKVKDVPRYKQALTELKKSVSGVAGLEKELSEIEGLLAKKSLTLSDVQRVKELMDDHFKLYTVVGDVQSGAAKLGLDAIRKDLRKFIEDVVDKDLGVDISKLNKDVAMGKSLSDLITRRAPTGLAKSNLTLGDLALFGSTSAFGSPLLGTGLLVAKKILYSDTIRLRFARWLDKLDTSARLKVLDDLNANKIPDALPESLKKEINDLPEIPKGSGAATPKTATVEGVEQQAKKAIAEGKSVEVEIGGEVYDGVEILENGKKIGEVAIEENVALDIPEILGIKSTSKGGGTKIIENLLSKNDKYYVRATSKAKGFWEKMGIKEWKYNKDAGLYEGTLTTDIYNKAKGTGSLEQQASKAIAEGKSVDEFIESQGVRIFHGTPYKIEGEKLSIKFSGSNMENETGALFFTDNKRIAKNYSQLPQSEMEAISHRQNDLINERISKGMTEQQARQGGNIIEARITPKNPIIYDAKGNYYDYDLNVKLIQEAQRNGNDVVIIKNVAESDNARGILGTTYAILDTNTIKTKQQLTDIYNKAKAD